MKNTFDSVDGSHKRGRYHNKSFKSHILLQSILIFSCHITVESVTNRWNSSNSLYPPARIGAASAVTSKILRLFGGQNPDPNYPEMFWNDTWEFNFSPTSFR